MEAVPPGFLLRPFYTYLGNHDDPNWQGIKIQLLLTRWPVNVPHAGNWPGFDRRSALFFLRRFPISVSS